MSNNVGFLSENYHVMLPFNKSSTGRIRITEMSGVRITFQCVRVILYTKAVCILQNSLVYFQHLNGGHELLYYSDFSVIRLLSVFYFGLCTCSYLCYYCINRPGVHFKKLKHHILAFKMPQYGHLKSFFLAF